MMNSIGYEEQSLWRGLHGNQTGFPHKTLNLNGGKNTMNFFYNSVTVALWFALQSP